MPPLHRVREALTNATELFAAELAVPRTNAPDWNEFEWTMARAAAVMHGVTPLLATKLRWAGPPQWEHFIDEQHQHTSIRQQRVEVLLAQIGQAATAAGVATMALKSAALLARGLYRVGDRPTADIDLLVRAADVRPMSAVLEGVGYQRTFETWKHIIFEPRNAAAKVQIPGKDGYGEHRLMPIKIDLHTHINEHLATVQPDITDHIWPAGAHCGMNAYPSAARLMMHLLLHTAGNMVPHTLRLIQLHDIAILAASMPAGEWTAFRALRVGGLRPLWLLPPLELVARYYQGCIPEPALAELALENPQALRDSAKRTTISEVSYASLENEMLPGVKRILRWVLRRPPRLPAMYVVRAALAAAHH